MRHTSGITDSRQRATFSSGQFKTGNLDDCVGAAADAELSQDLGDMNLDCRDGDIEFVSDVLVLKTSTNHVENTKLLGRQASQLTQQVLNFRAGAPGCRAPMQALRDIDLPLQN